jgi:hypothetical protein
MRGRGEGQGRIVIRVGGAGGGSFFREPRGCEMGDVVIMLFCPFSTWTLCVFPSFFTYDALS